MGDSFIGRGERTAKKILEKIFPEAEIFAQVPICNMVSKEIYDFYDPETQGSSVDIVMEWKDKVHAIRIQDNHHTSAKTSQKDSIQKKDMKDNGVIVVDIFERESPYLFRNLENYRSYLEVLLPLQKALVKP